MQMVNAELRGLSDVEYEERLRGDAGTLDEVNAGVVKLQVYSDIQAKVADGSYGLLQSFVELRKIGYSLGEAVDAEVDAWGGNIPSVGKSDLADFFRGQDPAQFS